MIEPRRDLQERTFEFARRVVKLCQKLDESPGVSRTLANQLLRSACSIGANVEEGRAGQSRADFISKYCIACKEARETHYWLRLLAAAEVAPPDRLSELIEESKSTGRYPHDYHQEGAREQQEMSLSLHSSLF